MQVLSGLDSGRGAVALVSAESGVCLLWHHSTGLISVCHSPAYHEFVQSQHERVSTNPGSSSPSSGWQRMLGLNQGKTKGRGVMEEEAEEDGGQVVVEGLQCVELAGGKALAMYVVGGSQVAVLDFDSASPSMRLLDVVQKDGAGEVAGGGGGGAGGIMRVHPLGYVEAQEGATASWSWLLQLSDVLGLPGLFGLVVLPGLLLQC